MNDINTRNLNVKNSKTFQRIANTYETQNKRVLDLGCGYGEYMQRFGKDSVGITTTMDEVQYGRENNIDIRFGNVELLDQVIEPSERFDLIWANNLFEHLLSPHAFLVNLKKFAKDDTALILGVPMVPKVSTLMKVSKFRGALASPHINFFTRETFKLTVEYAGWKVIDTRSFFFQSKTLDQLTSNLAPHIYLYAKNNPDYRYPEKKIKEWENDPHYAKLLAAMDGSAAN